LLSHIIEDAIKEHFPMILAAAFALLIGLGVQLTVDLKGESVFTPQYLWEFIIVFMLAPIVMTVLRTGRDVFQRRPWTEIQNDIRTLFSPQTFVRVFICFVCAYSVVIVFGALKSLIGLLLTPHGHDFLFIAIERFIHFGRLPHEYFVFVYNNPDVFYTFDFFYGLWFVVMYVYLAWIVFQPAGTPGRMQYLVSFCLCWTVIGNVLAAAGASAGPIFWQYYIPGPNPYAQLLAAIDALNAQNPLFRTEFKNAMLEMMHNRKMVDMNGPAALPSVHVGMAALFFLHARQYNTFLMPLMGAYLVIIILGSFLLSWHYALDSYIGLGAMILIWIGAGKFTRRWEAIA
jgi:hypothetical protein